MSIDKPTVALKLFLEIL